LIPFKLLLITDWSRPDCLEAVRDALHAGPEIAVQHRHPGATDAAFYEEGCRLREAIGSAPLFVNGRLDLALALDAHLHLNEGSLAPAEVRPFLKGGLVSASWHPPTIPREGIDLLLMSPVFDPISKPAVRPALGREGFRRHARPDAFALGGITTANVGALRPLAGVAVIGEVLHAPSPAKAAEALLRALE
jgi:thiamine-phosphate pyrophosphorylase